MFCVTRLPGMWGLFLGGRKACCLKHSRKWPARTACSADSDPEVNMAHGEFSRDYPYPEIKSARKFMEGICVVPFVRLACGFRFCVMTAGQRRRKSSDGI